MLKFHLNEKDYQLNHNHIFFKANILMVNCIFILQINIIKIETTTVFQKSSTGCFNSILFRGFFSIFNIRYELSCYGFWFIYKRFFRTPLFYMLIKTITFLIPSITRIIIINIVVIMILFNHRSFNTSRYINNNLFL